jgi:hypothetical protein
MYGHDYPLSLWERVRVRASGRARHRVTRRRIALVAFLHPASLFILIYISSRYA